MKSVLVILFVLIVVLCGCKKSNSNKPACENNQTGYVCFKNQSSNKLQISLDGVTLFSVDKNQRICRDYSTGNHLWEARIVTQNGTPLDSSGNLTVSQCDTVLNAIQ